MFGISMWELGLIVVIALIALGPRQLAEAAKVAGRLYRELTKLTDDLRSSIDLDSMTADSSPSEKHSYDPSPPPSSPEDDSHKTHDQDMHQFTDPNGRTGADFYAQLLEESREEEPLESEAAEHHTEEAESEHQGIEQESAKEERKQK